MQVKDLTEKLKELKEQIVKCKSTDALKKYLDIAAKFHKYSISNCMLIHNQLPTASKVMGYRKWKDEMNRQVRKGEHAIKILAPCMTTVKDEKTGEKTKHISFFRVVNVFDVSQTDGDPIPTWDTSNPEQQDKLYKNLYNVMKKDEANKTISYKVINEYKINSNVTTTDFGAVLHHYAFYLLHVRDAEKSKDLTQRDKEVDAETAAYIICKHFDIEHDSAVYLSAWSRWRDPFKEIERVKKIASEIINKITLNKILT